MDSYENSDEVNLDYNDTETHEEEQSDESSANTQQKPYVCEFCFQSFNYKCSWVYHLQRHSGDMPHACDLCDKKFAIKSHLDKHLKNVHVAERSHLCKICGSAFKTQKAMLDHLKRVHADIKNFKCDECDKEFFHKGALKVHYQIHTGEKAFVCDLCPRTFRRKQHMEEHVEMHTGEKPYACDLCDKAFPIKRYLRVHMKSHASKEADTSCDLCRKTFQNRAGLDRHKVNTHSGKRRYACNVCDKSFSLIDNFRKHSESLKHLKKVSRSEQSYECALCCKIFVPSDSVECNLEFKRSEQLAEHLEMPSSNINRYRIGKEKNYICNACNTLLVDMYVKKASNELSTDNQLCMDTVKDSISLNYQSDQNCVPAALENPYTCNKCNETFSEKHSLSKHIQMHGDLECYCSLCKKYFVERRSLYRHLRTHTGAKPYKCDHCQKAFSMKDVLRTHIKRFHDNLGVPSSNFSVSKSLSSDDSSLTTTETFTQTNCTNDSSSCSKLPIPSLKALSEKAYFSALQLDAPQMNSPPNEQSVVFCSISSAENPYACNICSMIFPKEDLLSRHLKKHEESYCHLCKRYFVDKRSLYHHFRTHTGEKPYKCDLCQKAFTYKSALITHMRRIHVILDVPGSNVASNKSLSSDDIPLITPKSLNIMQPTNSSLSCNELPIPSLKALSEEAYVSAFHLEPPQCSLSLTEESSVPRNKQSCVALTAENSYACNRCSKTFSRKDLLSRHSQTHDESYCSFCKKYFSNRKSLRHHIGIHTGEKPYSCNVCQKAFNSKSGLTRHTQKIHASQGVSSLNCTSNFGIFY